MTKTQKRKASHFSAVKHFPVACLKQHGCNAFGVADWAQKLKYDDGEGFPEVFLRVHEGLDDSGTSFGPARTINGVVMYVFVQTLYNNYTTIIQQLYYNYAVDVASS